MQRDFLQGGSVDDYLQQALKPVAARDAQEQELNVVRRNLGLFGEMRGIGVPQPHTRRTSLCEIPASDFSEGYTAAMARVREWVLAHTAGGGGGRVWQGGGELAASVKQLSAALNAQEIPSASNVIDAYTHDVQLQAIDELKTKLDALTLPVDAATLQASAAELIGSARRTVRRRSFGDGAASEKGGGSLFEREGEAAVRASMDANFKASHEVCEVLWGKCSSSLASLKLATLPSRRRFTARVASCNATMVSCTGPAAAGYDARLDEAVAAGRVEYGEAFFAKLSHLLILTCFGGILFFRYVYAFALGELACWFVLLSVEVLPRLVSVTQFSSVPATFWESPAGAAALAYYEAIVYNECAALDSIGAARIPLPPRHRLPF